MLNTTSAFDKTRLALGCWLASKVWPVCLSFIFVQLAEQTFKGYAADFVVLPGE
jgi:arginine exporter protein ArgO